MPWRLKRELVLVVIGALVLALAVVVLVLNRDAATELLGSAGVLVGLAIVIGALPVRNGSSS